MLLSIIDALAECLDRESVRRVVKLRLDAGVLKRLAELSQKENLRTLAQEEHAELALLAAWQELIVALQQKGRAMLRRPTGSKPSSR